jgi:toxin ParE1/3/4
MRGWPGLAEKDRDAAKAAAETIRKQAAILNKFPNAGRPAEDLEPEHRELPVPFGASGYVLLYRVEKPCVYILAVRHQKEVEF